MTKFRIIIETLGYNIYIIICFSGCEIDNKYANKSSDPGVRKSRLPSGPAHGIGDIGSRLGRQILGGANFRGNKYFFPTTVH